MVEDDIAQPHYPIRTRPQVAGLTRELLMGANHIHSLGAVLPSHTRVFSFFKTSIIPVLSLESTGSSAESGECTTWKYFFPNHSAGTVLGILKYSHVERRHSLAVLWARKSPLVMARNAMQDRKGQVGGRNLHRPNLICPTSIMALGPPPVRGGKRCGDTSSVLVHGKRAYSGRWSGSWSLRFAPGGQSPAQPAKCECNLARQAAAGQKPVHTFLATSVNCYRSNLNDFLNGTVTLPPFLLLAERTLLHHPRYEFRHVRWPRRPVQLEDNLQVTL